MHKLYQQKQLPYLNVKVCPVCNELVPLDKDVCPNCTHDFRQVKKVVVVKTVEKDNTNPAVPFSKPADVNNENKVEQVKEEKPVVDDVKNTPVEKVEKTPVVESKPEAKVEEKPVIENKKVEENKTEQKVEEKQAEKTEVKLEEDKKVEKTNVEPSNEDVNSQVIVNKTEEPENKKEKVKKERVKKEKIKKEKTKKEIEYNDDLNTFVNMGRKSLFLGIQLLVAILLLVIITMSPIFVKGQYLSEMFSSLTNSGDGALLSGKGFLFELVPDAIKNKGFNLSVAQTYLTTAEGNILFSDGPLNFLVKLFGNDTEFFVHAALVVVGSVYIVVYLALVGIVITSIIGFFRKTPLKGKSLGWLVWSLVYGLLVLYTVRISPNFSNYDSWLLMAFAISFILWIVVKIVLGKEAKIYKYLKTKRKDEEADL